MQMLCILCGIQRASLHENHAFAGLTLPCCVFEWLLAGNSTRILAWWLTRPEGHSGPLLSLSALARQPLQLPLTYWPVGEGVD